MGAHATGDEGLGARTRRARGLVGAGRLDEADALARGVLAEDAAAADALAVRGYVAARRGALEQSASFVAAAVALRREPLWLALLADLHRNLYRLDEAERWAREAIERANGQASGQASGRGRASGLSALGRVLTERGDLPGAAEANRRILVSEPDNPFAHFALGEALLGLGEWQPGWREYEWRRRLPGVAPPVSLVGIPSWNGMRSPSARLLVFCDQGFGDAIQFSRFLPAAAARVGELTVACAASVADVLERVPGVAHTRTTRNDRSADPAHYTAQVAIGSLPLLLDPAGAAIGKRPVLAADSARLAEWEQVLAALRPGAPRVGLVWSGKREHPNDRRRSLPLRALLPVVRAAPDAMFVSLDKQRTDADASDLEANGVLDVAGALSTFGDTAALLRCLDLLLTIDSAPAHLAGALGVETWMLTPTPSDWRWGIAGERSRWYETLRLFRQPTPGDWAGALAAVEAALGDLLRTRAPRT